MESDGNHVGKFKSLQQGTKTQSEKAGHISRKQFVQRREFPFLVVRLVTDGRKRIDRMVGIRNIQDFFKSFLLTEPKLGSVEGTSVDH